VIPAAEGRDQGSADNGDAPCDAAEPTRRTRHRRLLAACRRRRPRTVFGILTVVGLTLITLIYFGQSRPDQHTDSEAAASALAAASKGTVAVLSYSPSTLDKDFANAESHLTGNFLTYYTQFTREVIAPAAKQKSVLATAKVVRAAMSDLKPDKAVVLVFINQVTTSADRPDPVQTSSSVLITLLRENANWLISEFNPI